MKTREVFCVCLVLTPIFAILNGGIALVVMLWLYFAYKAYMNHLHQQEVNMYIYVRDHITYEEQREYAKYYEDRINKGESTKSLIQWYVEKKNKEYEDRFKKQAEECEQNK